MKSKITRQQRRKMERDKKKNRIKTPKIINLNFTEPDIVNLKKEKNHLYLTLKRNTMTYNVIITRIGTKKFVYEDVGLIKRTFTDIDYLIWEFELPKHLKSDLESLPIGDIEESDSYTDSDLFKLIMKQLFSNQN